MSCGIDVNIAVRRVDGGEDVCRLVSDLVLADVDQRIVAVCLRACHTVGIAARLPYGARVRRGRRRPSAKLRRHGEHDGGGIAVDPVWLDHRDLVEAGERLVVGEILCLPCVFRRIVTVRKDAQRITKLEPEALRVIFGIELAEPAFLLPDRSDLCPISRIVRQQV